ncbi:MAG: Holliday junction resolvase RecU [Firmicutes bacterium]|nr:Holliday junction resolvase RecU [Bacillota bacterium]
MGYWNTRGLRGSAFEDLINMTNDVYKQRNVAIIQKIPTPITPVKLDKEHGQITLAYFDKQSTVDYIGAVQGIAVCFDAKETREKRLPMQNIHEHQMDFMEHFERQDGVSFLLVHFAVLDEYYYLPFPVLKKYWDEAQRGGRKSVPYTAFEQKYRLYPSDGYPLNYLEGINTYLADKENSD